MKMYSNLPIGLHDITEAKKRLTNHIYKTSEIPSFLETQIIPSVRVYKRCCFR